MYPSAVLCIVCGTCKWCGRVSLLRGIRIDRKHHGGVEAEAKGIETQENGDSDINGIPM